MAHNDGYVFMLLERNFRMLNFCGLSLNKMNFREDNGVRILDWNLEQADI